MSTTEANGYTGEVVLRTGPHAITLRMRYREIAALISAFGRDWPQQYHEALSGDAALQAKILAITSGKTEDEILDLSPPLGLMTVQEPMVELFYIAQYGNDWKTKREEANKKEERGPLQSLIRSLLGSQPPGASESRSPISGA